jgi:excisionase family DNA binding protein
MRINKANAPYEEFCTTANAAKLLKISIGTVVKLIKNGELQAWKTNGGHHRLQMQSVIEYRKKFNLENASPLDQSHQQATDNILNASKELKVLMIEHDAPTRESVKRAIDKMKLPIDFIMKASAMEVLIQIESLHPDVLITDLTIPGVDCFEFLRILHANPSFTNIHLLAFTNLSESEVEVQGGLPEHTVRLRKPVDQSWLNGYLVALVAARRNQSLALC